MYLMCFIISTAEEKYATFRRSNSANMISLWRDIDILFTDRRTGIQRERFTQRETHIDRHTDRAGDQQTDRWWNDHSSVVDILFFRLYINLLHLDRLITCGTLLGTQHFIITYSDRNLMMTEY